MSDTRIQLSNGVLFDLLQPDPELIDIEVIAHALSKLCRFTGHSRAFYSVAQHCVVVSRLVPAELALCGLLHDATEAFVGDMSTPLKALLPEYRAIEENIMDAIAERFNIPLWRSPEIKHADRVAMSTERRDLGLPGNNAYWGDIPPPAPWTIIPLEAYQARFAFLARFAEIVMRPGEDQAPAPQQPSQRRYMTNRDLSREAAAAREGAPYDSETEVIG